MGIRRVEGRIEMRSAKQGRKPLVISIMADQFEKVKESLLKQIYCAISKDF